MSDETRVRLRRWTAATLTIVAVAGAMWVAPTAVAEPRKTIAEVEAELAALETKAEMAAEQYNGAEARLERINRTLDAAKGKVDVTRRAFAAESQAVAQLASQVYRSGGMDASVQLLMADDPQDFLRQATAVEQLAKTQSSALRRTTTARLALAQATAALGQQQAQAEAVVTEMKQARAEVDKAVEESKTLLSSLQEEERKRLEALAAQRRADAMAAARAAAERAAAEARATRDERPVTTSPAAPEAPSAPAPAPAAPAPAPEVARPAPAPAAPKPTPKPARPSSPAPSAEAPSDDSSVSARASIAVQYALSQVGKPYSYSARPPSSWDCSKLTAWAWRQAGVSLTAYSYAQAGQVRRISTSQLRPGDLLFYFNGAHHVSMYIGGGQIVEAASPRSGVKISALWNGWNRSHFSFAGRPLG